MGCRRSFKSEFPGQEVMCGKHWRLAPQPMRRVLARSLRRWRKAYTAYERAPPGDGSREHPKAVALRACEARERAHFRLWNRIKRYVTDVVVGIG